MILLKYSAEVSKIYHLSSDWDYELWIIIKRINEEFFNILTTLSRVYNKNYYALSHKAIYKIEKDLETRTFPVHSNMDNKEAVLMNIKIQLIVENYKYVLEAIESSDPPRNKLSLISEFEFFQLFAYDRKLILKYLEGLGSGLNDLYKYISTFVGTLHQLIQEHREQEHVSDYETLKYLCPLGKSIFRTIIHTINALPESNLEYPIISDRIKTNLVDPSRFLFELLGLKAMFKSGYLFIECTFQEENINMPVSFVELPEHYDETNLPKICRYLKDWDLIKCIKDGC